MQLVFMITALISLIYIAAGIAYWDGGVHTLQTYMGIGGLIMSGAWYFLYDHIHRMRKQLDALSAAILGADESKPAKPK
jgi:hypothetical protein